MKFLALILFFSGFTLSWIHCGASQLYFKDYLFAVIFFFSPDWNCETCGDWQNAFTNASYLLNTYHPHLEFKKLDCSFESEYNGICRKLSIEKPQIRIFKRGHQILSYQEEPDSSKIENFVKSNIKPSVHALPTLESIKEFRNNDKIVFIGSFDNGSNLEKVFFNVADKNYQGPYMFGVATADNNKFRFNNGFGILHYHRDHITQNIMPIAYTGEESEDAFDEYVHTPHQGKKREKSSHAITSLESLDEFLKNDTGAFIGAFEKGSEYERVFLKAAAKDYDGKTVFAHSSDSSVLEKLGQRNGILYYPPNHIKDHLEPIVYHGKPTLDALESYISHVITITTRRPIPVDVLETRIQSCQDKVRVQPIVAMITTSVWFFFFF